MCVDVIIERVDRERPCEAVFRDVQRKVADFLLICKGKCQELLSKYEL